MSDIVPALSLDLYSEAVVLRNTFCFYRKLSFIKYDMIKWDYNNFDNFSLE